MATSTLKVMVMATATTNEIMKAKVKATMTAITTYSKKEKAIMIVKLMVIWMLKVKAI
ncbi:MAG: hypothetical protein WC919_04925 [Candidatus Paceibacterota bacterium]